MVCAHFVFLCNKTKIIKFYSFTLNIIKEIKISGGVILDVSLQRTLRLVGLCSRKRRMSDFKYINTLKIYGWTSWERNPEPLQL